MIGNEKDRLQIVFKQYQLHTTLLLRENIIACFMNTNVIISTSYISKYRFMTAETILMLNHVSSTEVF